MRRRAVWSCREINNLVVRRGEDVIFIFPINFDVFYGAHVVLGFGTISTYS